MGINPKKIIIEDTNIWISFLISPNGKGFLIDALDDPKFQFLTCQEQIREIKDVTARPKFRKWFTKELADDLITVLESKCHNIEIDNKQTAVRDHKDNFLVNLAIQGEADIIVSGDDDIKAMEGKLGKTQVFSLTEFLTFYINYSHPQKSPKKD